MNYYYKYLKYKLKYINLKQYKNVKGGSNYIELSYNSKLPIENFDNLYYFKENNYKTIENIENINSIYQINNLNPDNNLELNNLEEILDSRKKLIIKINDKYFKIIEKIISRRDLVTIHSSSNEDFSTYTEFAVYRSVSELGIFRLCLFSFGQYFKGSYDYVQQTFIHIELQKFINNNYDRIPIIVIPSNICSNDWLALADHIDDTERKLSIEPFKSYYDSHKCGEKIHDTTNMLNKFSEQLEKIYTVVDNPLQLYEYSKQDENNNYKIIINKIILKNSKNEIILYYGICTICKFDSTYFTENSECKFRNMYIPVFITNDESISIYGTYNKYILAGNYICKFFDYHQQCDISDRSKCTTTYSLIGDRYNNLFPFNKIK
jgi:hypothetical protein